MDFFLANSSPSNLHTNRQLQQQQRRWATKKPTRSTRTAKRASNAAAVAAKARKPTPLEAEQQKQQQQLQKQTQQSKRQIFVKMNLLMVCVLLLVALICQPTLIYGLRGGHHSAAGTISQNGDHDLVHHQRNGVKTFGGKVKRSRSHSLHATPAELASAKLVMAMESGDVLVRRAARGANVESVDDSTLAVDAAAGGSGSGKRNKNGNSNNNNKKLNKNSDAPNGGRKQEKKFSATIGGQAQQQQHHGHHGSGNGSGNGNGNGNGNGKGRQRQQLRSQHQGHSKRGGNSGNGNGNGSNSGSKVRMESVEKTTTSEKTQSSCRYSKGAWTDCDPKTNVRTRTLTLKKGESTCLATRTMQKKCKKPCRYEKGAWSECTNGQMTRLDKLKTAAAKANLPVNTDATDANSDSSCEPIRKTTKRCNSGGAKMANKANKERKHKDKAQRRAQQEQGQ